MKAAPKVKLSERTGRWLGRGWRGVAHREVRAIDWLATQGIPTRVGRVFFWVVKLALHYLVLPYLARHLFTSPCISAHICAPPHISVRLCTSQCFSALLCETVSPYRCFIPSFYPSNLLSFSTFYG